MVNNIWTVLIFFQVDFDLFKSMHVLFFAFKVYCYLIFFYVYITLVCYCSREIDRLNSDAFSFSINRNMKNFHMVSFCFWNYLLIKTKQLNKFNLIMIMHIFLLEEKRRQWLHLVYLIILVKNKRILRILIIW